MKKYMISSQFRRGAFAVDESGRHAVVVPAPRSNTPRPQVWDTTRQYCGRTFDVFVNEKAGVIVAKLPNLWHNFTGYNDVLSRKVTRRLLVAVRGRATLSKDRGFNLERGIRLACARCYTELLGVISWEMNRKLVALRHMRDDSRRLQKRLRGYATAHEMEDTTSNGDVSVKHALTPGLPAEPVPAPVQRELALST